MTWDQCESTSYCSIIFYFLFSTDVQQSFIKSDIFRMVKRCFDLKIICMGSNISSIYAKRVNKINLLFFRCKLFQIYCEY